MFEVALSEYGFRMGYGAAIAVVLFLIMLCFIAYFLYSMYGKKKGALRCFRHRSRSIVSRSWQITYQGCLPISLLILWLAAADRRRRIFR